MSKQRDLGRWPVIQQIDPTFRAEGHDAQNGDVAAKFARTCDAQAHKITDAIAAAVVNAQAGLNLLRAQPLDLEGVRRLLTSIANDGRRAGEIVVRLLRTTALGPPHRCIRSERW